VEAQLHCQTRVAAVTGAGGGLGRAVALRLARRGLDVACADVDTDGLDETVDLVRSSGGRVIAQSVDLTDERQIATWQQRISAEFGIAQILINCAGVLDRRQLGDLSVADFMRVVEVNLGGTYATCRAFAPKMVESRWGRIVNIASIASLRGYPFPAYAASKAAVANLAQSLLVDLWGTGVTVNTVSPGAMDTPMLDPDARARMIARTPSAVVADPGEVAAAVVFLCGEEARSINGASLVIDGGATAVFSYGELGRDANS